jgi:hypothetical protein
MLSNRFIGLIPKKHLGEITTVADTWEARKALTLGQMLILEDQWLVWTFIAASFISGKQKSDHLSREIRDLILFHDCKGQARHYSRKTELPVKWISILSLFYVFAPPSDVRTLVAVFLSKKITSVSPTIHINPECLESFLEKSVLEMGGY